MATRIWSAASNGNWSDAANWDGGLSVPSSNDAIVFDATSDKNCVIDNLGTWSGGTIDTTGYTGSISAGFIHMTAGNVTVKGPCTVNLSGLDTFVCNNFTVDDTGGAPTFTACTNWTCTGTWSALGSPSVTMGVGTITFSGASNAAIIAPPAVVTFNKVVVNKTGTLTVTAGVIPLGANPTVHVSAAFPGFRISTGSEVTASGTITMTGYFFAQDGTPDGILTGAVTQINITDGGFVFNSVPPSGCHIKLTDSDGSHLLEFCSGGPVDVVEFVGAGAGGIAIYDISFGGEANIVGTMIDDDNAFAHSILIDAGSYRIDTWQISGISGKEVTVNGNGGTVTIHTASGVDQSSDYLILQDIHVDASPKWYAGSHSTDNGNNDNWIFTDPPPATSNIAHIGKHLLETVSTPHYGRHLRG